ncbi:MAG: uracil-DNA glycosylase [SAR324 cluster bacterium]|nr:uracil-DNA glycosylase [SAR324 cluster bacterium]
MPNETSSFDTHVKRLRACRLCAGVQGPPVLGAVAGARVFLMGQAPGPREQREGRPFVWTAGTTLFRWFATIGVDEALFRERVYMGAVIRCFPGKMANGKGDRRPAPVEMAACRPHFAAELALLKPELVLAVGRMAIDEFLPAGKLDGVVGQAFPVTRDGHRFSCVPLPHPSGLNRWIQSDAGKALLRQGLGLIARHPAWRATFPEARAPGGP